MEVREEGMDSNPNYLSLFDEKDLAIMAERLASFAAHLKLRELAADAGTLFALKRGEIPERFRVYPART